MAGISPKLIVQVAFPLAPEALVEQACIIAANFHLSETEFADQLEALRVNVNTDKLDEFCLAKFKDQIVKQLARSSRSSRSNKENTHPTPAKAVEAPTIASAFSQRSDAGQVVIELKASGYTEVSASHSTVEILTPAAPGYFYNDPRARVACMVKRLTGFIDIFEELYHIEVEKLTHISETEMNVVGRIVAEDNARLSAANLYIQDKSDQVELDVSRVDDFVLYPGKIVVAAGMGSSNRLKFTVNTFHQAIPSPIKEKYTDESAHVVVACGPFTCCENLDFEPLLALKALLAQEPCSCLVLCGPFLDCEHPKLKGEACPPSSLLGSNYTYDEAFGTLLQETMRKGLRCEVVVVPSVQDLVQLTPIPQQPYKCPTVSGLHMAPNPCCLTVNGLLFGVSTIDVLREIAVNSFSKSTRPVNRIRQAFNEILEQRSFLPLCPSEAPVDMQHAELLHLSASPDVLIVSSKMAKCVEVVGETLCINPGSLAKGSEGGSYARIRIAAGSESVRDRSYVQIIQI